jgi:hypothetical protein
MGVWDHEVECYRVVKISSTELQTVTVVTGVTGFKMPAGRKWGSAYLTKDFFLTLGATMSDRVLLVVAYDDSYSADKPVAGALNLIGSDALFGRNWGCRFGDRYKHLHFELCYYQAIEAAIELGLKRVEAGAQVKHRSAASLMIESHRNDRVPLAVLVNTCNSRAAVYLLCFACSTWLQGLKVTLE